MKSKHYYDDSGVMQFALSAKSIASLGKAMPDGLSSMELRSHIIEEACGVMNDYHCHEALPGIGGCLTLSEWRAEPSTGVEEALKEMVFEFTDAGFLWQEFLLVVFAATCDIIMVERLSR